MASVRVALGAGPQLQTDLVGSRVQSVQKSSSSPNLLMVAGPPSPSIRAQQVQNRDRPVRPAVSFPLFPRNLDAYSGVSGKSTAPVVYFAQDLEEEQMDKERQEAEERKEKIKKKVRAPALSIVMKSDVGVEVERRW